MASSGDDPPHGKTRVLQAYTAADFGPLSVYKKSDHDRTNYCNDFRGGSYRMTTPIGDALVLHRLYGGTAESAGHYWTAEKREGNVGYQLDFAMRPEWGSTLESRETVYVPRGVVLFEGHAETQRRGGRDFGGGGWQVFIPLSVITPLLEAQQAKADGKPPVEVQKHLKEAVDAQSSFIAKYEKQASERSQEYLESFCSHQTAQRLLASGNAIQSLPNPVKKALQSESSSDQSETMPEGSYLLHRQDVRLPTGTTVSVSLYIRMEFSHETQRTYQSGTTRVTQITRHYKRIFEWK